MTGDRTVSRCGACGRKLEGVEPGQNRFCPHTYRVRRTRHIADEDERIGDPAATTDGGAP